MTTEQTKACAALARESIRLGFQLHRREGDAATALARLREIHDEVRLVVEQYAGDAVPLVRQSLVESYNCVAQTRRWGEAIVAGKKYALHVGRISGDAERVTP
jgi:hypothetical protein